VVALVARGVIVVAVKLNRDSGASMHHVDVGGSPAQGEPNLPLELSEARIGKGLMLGAHLERRGCSLAEPGQKALEVTAPRGAGRALELALKLAHSARAGPQRGPQHVPTKLDRRVPPSIEECARHLGAEDALRDHAMAWRWALVQAHPPRSGQTQAVRNQVVNVRRRRHAGRAEMEGGGTCHDA